MPQTYPPINTGDAVNEALKQRDRDDMIAKMKADADKGRAERLREKEVLEGVNKRLDEAGPLPGMPKLPPQSRGELMGKGKVLDSSGEYGRGLPDEPVGGPLTAGIARILKSLGKTEGTADELIGAVRATDPTAGKVLDEARASEAFRDHDKVTADQLEQYVIGAVEGGSLPAPKNPKVRQSFQAPNGKSYAVEFEPDRGGAADVNFMVEGRHSISATGDNTGAEAMRVLRAVQEEIAKDIATNARNAYYFVGNSETKSNIYTMLAQRTPAPEGYRWATLVHPDGDMLTLLRKDARPPYPEKSSPRQAPPTDEGARMERARAQGFDVDTPLYHGTPEGRGFDAFDPKKEGSNYGKKTRGAYFTTSKGNASTYSGYEDHGIVEAYIRPGKQLVLDWDGPFNAPRHGYKSTDEAIRKAQSKGYDSVRIRNVQDTGFYGAGAGSRAEMADTVVVFDPKNIRRTDAQFDPSQEGSSRLLAGVGGGFVLVGGLYLTPEEAEAQEKGDNSPIVRANIEEVERKRLLDVLNAVNEAEGEETDKTPPAKDKGGADIREIAPGQWALYEKAGIVGPDGKRATPRGAIGPDLLKATGRGVRNALANLPENMAITANDMTHAMMTQNIADPDDPFTKLFAMATGNEEGLEANRNELERWEKHRATVEKEILNAGEALDDFARDKTKFLGESENLPEALIEGLSQYLTGFLASRKLFGGKAPTSIKGTMASGAVHGTVAENAVMDPTQQSLIGTITEFFPEAKNPLTSFFTVQPDDRAAVARLKRSLEGMGLGIVLDSVILPLAKAVRGAKEVDQASAAVVRAMEPEQRQLAFEAAVEAQRTQKVSSDLGQLGDPQRDIITIEPTPAPVVENADAMTRGAQRMARSAAQPEKAGVTGEDAALAFGQEGVAKPEGKLTINFARIDAPEDIEHVIGQMADTMKPQLDRTRRGVQTFEQTRLEADEINAWEAMAKRRPGEPLNAEQSVAVRELWVSSGRKLREVSMAAAADPSPGNIAAARRMLAIYQAVQSEVISARTETARALSSWRIPVSGTSTSDLKALDDMIGRAGGETANAEFFKRLATADAQTMSNVAERGVFARTADALYSAWINGLLSGPKSHVTNALSGFQMLFLGPLEKAVAGGFRAMTGGEGVRAREAVTQIASLPEAFREAWVYAQRVAKMTGEKVGAQFDNAALNAEKDATERALLTDKISAREAEIKRIEEEKRLQNPAAFSSGAKFSTDRAESLSARAWGLNPASSAGIAMDSLFWAFKWPGKAMQFADELFKVMNYRMEVNALSMRMAQDAVTEGVAQPHEVRQMMDEFRANPPEDIRIQGADYAMYQTFTSPPTDGVKSLQRLLGKLPAARIFAPFINTPANIFRYSLERTPLAPFMRHVRDDMKAGGARRQMAVARMTLGNLALFSFISIAASGQIVGKGPAGTSERQAWARSGAKPYSAQLPDGSWITYNRADPVGFHIGLAADIVEIARALGDEEDDATDADVGEIIAIAAGSVAQNILAKSFMSGVSDVFEWASDPARYGEQTIERTGSSIIPAWMAEARRQADPVQREVGSFIDAFRNRIPGLSETLPAKRDMWGREMEYASGLGNVYDTLSPLYVSKGKAEPIDVEMQRLGLFVGMPPKTLTYDGVPIKLKNRPEAWSRYLQLSGNELKLPQYENMGAKDFLNATVSGKSWASSFYKIYGPERRQRWIRGVVEDYRDSARDELLEEFPEIAEQVATMKQRKQTADMESYSQGIVP